MNLNAYWQDFIQRFDFSAGTLKADILAGLTVSLVAIPQSLAYAQLAGVPAYYGLYAALIPTIVGALFGSSNQLSTGPVAMTSLLTAASIAPLAAQGTDLFISYVILLALISGLIQIAFGVMRAGIMLNFLSNPVLMGFINAAAIIIGLSQLPTLMGIPFAQSTHFMLDISLVILHIDQLHMPSLGFGLVAILLLVGFKQWAPGLPGVLVTVVVLTFTSFVIDYAGMGGAVVGVVPEGLPTLSVPPLDWQATVTLLPAAFVIALISFMEAMSSCKAISIKTRQPWDENRELIGQGLAKVAAAFCQSMPVSGSFSRSALNLASEAKTPLASIISALFVLITLLFFTSLLHHLPKPVLAAVIMVAVLNLVNLQSIKNAWLASKDDGVAALLTFIATLSFAPNIQNGILTGILLSLALLLLRLMHPRIAVLGQHSDTTLRDAVLHKLPPLHPQLGAIRFDGALRFVNVSYFENAILKLERENPRMVFILVQCSGINQIDASGIEMLKNLSERLESNGIHLAFSSVKHQVSNVMQTTGLLDLVGNDNIFATDRDAIATLRDRLEQLARTTSA
ncbi:MAG: SulP family inorganic anion transporter [Gammaproteobacteria bacterium]|nr:SulP family inorganic anion transporter [Gammaproteobacteria bacterium]